MSIFAATRGVLTTVPSRLRMQSYKPFPTYQNILHFFSQKKFHRTKKIPPSKPSSSIAKHRIRPIKYLTIKANNQAFARLDSFVINSTTHIHSSSQPINFKGINTPKDIKSLKKRPTNHHRRHTPAQPPCLYLICRDMARSRR